MENLKIAGRFDGLAIAAISKSSSTLEGKLEILATNVNDASLLG